jgi:mono/diheme cytochrome c family protein
LQAAVFGAAIAATTGCWEQWSDSWWPQMKWQRAVQPFELTGRPSGLGSEHREPGNLMPPEGSVPAGMPVRATDLPLAALEAMPNPNPPTLASLDRGRTQFGIFCAPCHGAQGLADGPVAGPPFGKGPFVGVLPIAGPIGGQIVKNFSDGHLFGAISQGIRRMPGYKRIPPEERWDIVNYVRYLNGTLGAPAPAAPTAAAAAGAAAAAPGGAN